MSSRQRPRNFELSCFQRWVQDVWLVFYAWLVHIWRLCQLFSLPVMPIWLSIKHKVTSELFLCGWCVAVCSTSVYLGLLVDSGMKTWTITEDLITEVHLNNIIINSMQHSAIISLTAKFLHAKFTVRSNRLMYGYMHFQQLTIKYFFHSTCITQ